MPDDPNDQKAGDVTPEPGSPEDIAARKAAYEAEQAAKAGNPDPKEDDGDPGDSGDPKSDDATKIEITKAEHDAQNAELRLLRKEKRDREKAKADAEREKAQKEAAASGDYEKGIELERAEKRAAQDRARRAELKLALSEAGEAREWNANQRKLATKLIDFESLEFSDDGEPLPESLSDVLDAIAAEYPEAFGAAKSADSKDPDDAEPRKKSARKTPGSMPKDHGGAPVEGYISPEEYADTPPNVRHSAAFQKRVEVSRDHWPTKVPHDAFAGGQGES
jgi:hypothetical protein